MQVCPESDLKDDQQGKEDKLSNNEEGKGEDNLILEVVEILVEELDVRLSELIDCWEVESEEDEIGGGNWRNDHCIVLELLLNWEYEVEGIRSELLNEECQVQGCGVGGQVIHHLEWRIGIHNQLLILNYVLVNAHHLHINTVLDLLQFQLHLIVYELTVVRDSQVLLHQYPA